MKELILALPEILLLTMLMAAFAIVCLTLHKVFEQMELFRGKLAVLMAGLVSALAIAGTAMLLVVPSRTAETGDTRNISVNYSLLPVVTLAGTVILLQLFVVAAASARDGADEPSTKEPAGRPAPELRGRPKKKEPAEAHSKAAARTAGSESVANKRVSDTDDGL